MRERKEMDKKGKFHKVPDIKIVYDHVDKLLYIYYYTISSDQPLDENNKLYCSPPIDVSDAILEALEVIEKLDDKLMTATGV